MSYLLKTEEGYVGVDTDQMLNVEVERSRALLFRTNRVPRVLQVLFNAMYHGERTFKIVKVEP